MTRSKKPRVAFLIRSAFFCVAGLVLSWMSAAPAHAFTAVVDIRFERLDGVLRSGEYPELDPPLQALFLSAAPGVDATVTTRVWPASEPPPSPTLRTLLVEKSDADQSQFLPQAADCVRLALLVLARPNTYDLWVVIGVSSHRPLADLKNHAGSDWELVVQENRVSCEIRTPSP